MKQTASGKHELANMILGTLFDRKTTYVMGNLTLTFDPVKARGKHRQRRGKHALSFEQKFTKKLKRVANLIKRCPVSSYN